MDSTSLILSLLFGMVGMGFAAYGKNAGRVVPIGVGLLLMGVPYFISSVMILLIVCLALTIVPFAVRG
jgi:hypothetical protein